MAIGSPLAKQLEHLLGYGTGELRHHHQKCFSSPTNMTTMRVIIATRTGIHPKQILMNTHVKLQTNFQKLCCYTAVFLIKYKVEKSMPILAIGKHGSKAK